MSLKPSKPGLNGGFTAGPPHAQAGRHTQWATVGAIFP